MGQPFLICGLPRSRTAWLSVVASGPNSITWHEPTAHLLNFKALKTLWNDDRFAYVGVSDSALVMQLGRILAEIQPRTLIVERSIPDVMRSLDLYFAADIDQKKALKHCRTASAELERYREHPLTRWIDFDALGDVTEVRAALAWLAPDARFPKLDEMMHMNVQVDPDWVLAEARKPHTNWHLDTSWSVERHT